MKTFDCATLSLDLNIPEHPKGKTMNQTQLALVAPVAGAAGIRMTSEDLAKLTGKRHDNVKRMIETLAKSGVIRLPKIEEAAKINNLGFTIKVKGYVFTEVNKRDSYVVVARLSPEFTARLVDRWQELEAEIRQQAPALPQNYKEALLHLVKQVEKTEAVEAELSIAAPKAAALDRIATKTEGALSLRDSAKSLQVAEKKFIQWLIAKGWVFRNNVNGRLSAYADAEQRGMVEVKATTTISDGVETIRPQVLITAKGLARLSYLLSKPGQNELFKPEQEAA